ncbi:MAG TPA: GAF domain-containing sensor histidine kinase [bacterium]|jgi:signal transduction histidine kinase
MRRTVLRDDWPELAAAIVAVRWVVLAALIVLETRQPEPGAAPFPLLYVYGAFALYVSALTLYTLQRPQRAAEVIGWSLVLDTAFVAAGAVAGGAPWLFLSLGLAVVALVGMFRGHAAATLTGAAVALAQFPLLPYSFFTPNLWIQWLIAAALILGTGNATAAAAVRLARRARVADALARIRAVSGAPGPVSEAAAAILDETIRLFDASSGSLMVVDPMARELEFLATRNLDEAHRKAWQRLGDGVAGWVAQEGQALLLSSGTTFPLPLKRPEIGSAMCIPVRTGGQPIAVLNVNRSTRQSRFTSADLGEAESVAQQAAALCMRAHQARRLSSLLTELADSHARVTTAFTRDPAVLWPALLDAVKSMTSAEFAVLALEQDLSGGFDLVGTQGITRAAARATLPALLAAASDGAVQAMRDPTAHEGHQLVCVPLTIGGHTIGAVGLGFEDDTQMSEQLLKATAAHVAAVVSTARAAYQVAEIGAVEERRRIARELHDGIAQTLADALLQTDLSTMAAQADPSQLPGDLRELRGILERSMRELREFMTELRRDELTDGRFFPALDALAKEFQRRHNLEAAVVTHGSDDHVSPAIRHAVLSIVRQALDNVRVHAQATQVTVRADVNDLECVVRVVDNGRGFDLAAYRMRQPTSHNLGLVSMQERAALVGAQFEIDTAPGRGTTVTVRVPLA